MLNEGGIIGINDYSIFENNYSYKRDPEQKGPKEFYTTQIVNDFLNQDNNWNVVGFALNDRLTSDIYITNTGFQFGDK